MGAQSSRNSAAAHQAKAATTRGVVPALIDPDAAEVSQYSLSS